MFITNATDLIQRATCAGTLPASRQSRAIACKAESSDTAQIAAGAAGIVSAPLCLYSEFVLKTTGSGLPPGPGGLVGAAEGISYLVCNSVLHLAPCLCSLVFALIPTQAMTSRGSSHH